MAEDHLRYDILAQEALRGVVRKVLAEVSRTGLPGEHHFFISFATRAPGVRLSEKLLTQYDKEMTIVLQNQYWDLKVNETGFEVGLSFDGVAPWILATVVVWLTTAVLGWLAARFLLDRRRSERKS